MPSFREFADALPRVRRETRVAGTAVGISRPDVRNPAFIEPTLTLRGGDPASATVVLVSAPAAVGKTMFAEALATDRGAPLWDLGQFSVGSGTFLGKLTETHGRHTAITNDAASGNSPHAVMKRAGHSDFKTTQGYIDLAGETFREEAERLEERLFGVPVEKTGRK